MVASDAKPAGFDSELHVSVPNPSAARLAATAVALPPLGPGEYYHHDLIGLPCVSTDGAAIGHVAAVENFGAGDILEIEKPAEPGKKPVRFMVPMNAQAVPAWTDDGVTIDAAFVE